MLSKKAKFEKIDEALKSAPLRAAVWALLKPGNPVPIVVLFNAAKPSTKSDNVRMQQYVGSHISNINKVLALYDLRIGPGDPRATYQLRPLYP